MPSTVEQLSPSRVKITVEVPFADLKPSLDKAYRDVASQVNIPGFRKGKVPSMVIDQRFGRGMIIQEAFNDTWSKFYAEAVTENKLIPLAQPEVEVTKLEDGDVIEFTAEVDIRPEFDLPAFDSLTATVDAVEVADDLVDAQLQTLRTRFGSKETVERPAETGDVLSIDLVARKDGEILEDAQAENLDYEVGSGSMLEGLDDAVLGLSAGESATFTSTLVGGPLKDEAADIEVLVSKVSKQELPELNDDFAQEASEFDTLDELKADIASRLTNMARLEQASQARDAVLENLIEGLDFEVPEGIRENEVQARKEQINGQLAQAGLTIESYLTETEEAPDAETFWADIEKRSGQALKAQIVLDKVADETDVQVDQNDLTQHIIRRAQQEGTSPQQIAAHIQEHPHHIDEYMLEIRRGKALALIVESAKVTDSNGADVELARLQADGSIGELVSEDDAADEEAPADA